MTYYVTLRSFPHYGEHAVLLGGAKNGRIPCWLLDCPHGVTKIEIERSDI